MLQRMLEERRRVCGEMRKRERDYVRDLEQTTEQLKKLLETKTNEIEKNKNDVIAQVKQTSGGWKEKNF